MNADPKRDYPPLLPPGFTEVDPSDLSRFLEPFRERSRRAFLIERYSALVAFLQNFGIALELWLDGSFVTCKPEPDDIDLVVLGEEAAVAGLSAEQKRRFRNLFSDVNVTKLRYRCHLFYCPGNDDILRQSWADFFGKSRNGQRKGLARCRI